MNALFPGSHGGKSLAALARVCLAAGLALWMGWIPASAVAADPAWLAERYTKFEHRIPMRDGVRLFTRVYVPKDDSTNYPIVITRTPYALKPYGADRYSGPGGSVEKLAKDGFILVSQDVRGRYGSEIGRAHV